MLESSFVVQPRFTSRPTWWRIFLARYLFVQAAETLALRWLFYTDKDHQCHPIALSLLNILLWISTDHAKLEASCQEQSHVLRNVVCKYPGQCPAGPVRHACNYLTLIGVVATCMLDHHRKPIIMVACSLDLFSSSILKH